MTTYYVDFVNGNDANNGLGPDASHASNKPWKTITKLLGAAGMSSGDTAYLSPAGPFRETVSVAMTSAVAETKILGDPLNAQGFKTSGGVKVAAGPVIVTAYTTNDKTAPSGTTLLNLAGRDHLTFQYILFVGGNNVALVTATTATSTDIAFKDCGFNNGFLANNFGIDLTVGFGVAANWTIDRCLFFGPFRATGTVPVMRVTLTTGSGSDYDANVVVENTAMIGSGVFVTSSGTSAQEGGGVKLRNVTCLYATALQTATTRVGGSTFANPCTINNSLIVGGGGFTGLIAAESGAITEDYNVIVATTARSLVSVGAHSISDGSYAPLVHFGQERIWGSPLFKPFCEPMQSSPLLGFGGDGTQTAYDLLNLQRPAGGASASPAVGSLERHNNWITDPSPIGGGATAIKLTGPGDQAFIIPVRAAQVSVSVVVKWDATYAGTKPQLQIDANGGIGVSAETVTATGGSGSNETLSLTPFTPTGAGQVVVRVKSNDTNGGGIVQADDFTVT